MTYILYNPKAGNGKCKSDVDLLHGMYPDAQFCDMTGIDSYSNFISGVTYDDSIIICGGDGTLNRFANDIKGLTLPCKVYYYAVGSGNDFAHDIGKGRADKPDFEIDRYLCDLPSVSINGEEKLFINGIGYGIDGYCCEEGDRIREATPEKKIDYTGIAIKGLLFKYKPTSATVTVDGAVRRYKKVWIAPTMNGRFYGGGMMPTPDQNRLDKDNKLSCMIFHDSGKLRTLMIFPSIFKGTHVKHTKYVDVLKGHKITVEFDSPRALQIDGETVLGVTKYTAKSKQPVLVK